MHLTRLFGPGATPVQQGAAGDSGTAFVVWAPSATTVQVGLCAPDGTETQRLDLQAAGNGLWAVWADGVGSGQLYGLRAHGPWAPAQGQRFNPAKLLLDPWAHAVVDPSGQAWAQQALRTGHTVPDPLRPNQAWQQHQPCPVDDAALRLRSVVTARSGPCPAPRTDATPPDWRVPDDRVVLYEAHVKALTRLHPGVPEALRGTYAGLAHPAVLDHLQRLGITTVCLLPVHAHIDERHLLARGLSNHWGYNPLNVFMPHPGYAACTGGQPPRTATDALAIQAEFQAMVDALHAAGLEVVLDVVFNHTCESDPDGPTLSWRGLGQADWYALATDGAPHNFSGCGNSLNVTHPRVIQWVMDSLRHGVQVLGVDGYRFDLGVSLGRDATRDHAFHPLHPLLSAMAQDPVLAGVRRIAEPWDIGPNGHHTGGFAPGWAEWNDGFRDTARAFWLGHPCTRGQLAQHVAASAARFATERPGVRHAGERPPTANIHLLTAHDGFTLHDLTAYTRKHNHANGEDNRDGHGHNLSHNAGVEGPSDDPAVQQRRLHWQRALLATLFCAQGTPQLLAGDEWGHSQQGNNNAYCQDNATTWLAWPTGDSAHNHTAFIAGLTALRRALPALRHPHWFNGQVPKGRAWPDIAWLGPDGRLPQGNAWSDPNQRTLGAVITVGEPCSPPDNAPRERVLIVWHALAPDACDTTPATFRLSEGPWQWRLHSATATVWPETDGPTVGAALALEAPGVYVLTQSLLGSTP
ncbi:glycogen debranching protein [Hydrogenophaga soli]